MGRLIHRNTNSNRDISPKITGYPARTKMFRECNSPLQQKRKFGLMTAMKGKEVSLFISNTLKLRIYLREICLHAYPIQHR